MNPLQQQPTPIVVNGVEIPEPNYDLTPGRQAWLVDLFTPETWEAGHCVNYVQLRALAQRGLVHYTKEAAEKHRAALLSFSEKK